MGKNNAFINQQKLLYQKINQITPNVYASLALALHRTYGWGFQRINRVFCESQEIWEECVNNGDNMIAMCERETGIDVQRKVEEQI